MSKLFARINLYQKNYRNQAMRNNYVGDIGDFLKFGLLRALCSPPSPDGLPKLSLGLIWYLTTHLEKNNDGKHTHHYERPEVYRDYDPELFDILGGLLKAKTRTVEAIRQSDIFHSDTIFFEEPLNFDGLAKGTAQAVEERLKHRKSWSERSKLLASKCDAIFVDPDNGLEIKSTKRHHNRGTKFVFYDELLPFIEQNKSLIIYQHKTRNGTVEAQIKARILEMHEILDYKDEIHTIYFRSLGGRSFFILPAKQHVEIIGKRLENMQQSPWKKHFKYYSSSEMAH